MFITQVHQPQKEQDKRPRVVKQRRTWTYEDENGRDLGQDYLQQREDDQETNVSIRLINSSLNSCVTFYTITFRVLLNWVTSV